MTGAGADASAGGTYTLLVTLPRPVRIEVGALGEHAFPGGAYAYTGSALGSGGFARVDRHRRLAAGDHDARHWHVDYLLGHPVSRLRAVATAGGVDAECEVARALEDGPVPGFGASDCSCASHLAYDPVYESLQDRVAAGHRERGGSLSAVGRDSSLSAVGRDEGQSSVE